MEYALTISNLYKKFPTRKGLWGALSRSTFKEVLRGVDLRIARGEVVGLVGQNGTGKSTLLRIVANTVLPDSGQVLVFGNNVLTDAAKVRKEVGYITGDERSFHFRLTIRQNLEFFAALEGYYFKAARHRVCHVVDCLNLGEFADIPYRHASSGIRQMALIARGLLGNARLILADEPTRSLDPARAGDTMELIRRHWVEERGAAMLMVGHNHHELESISHRMLSMDGGALAAFGPLQKGESPEEIRPEASTPQGHPPHHPPLPLGDETRTDRGEGKEGDVQ